MSAVEIDEFQEQLRTASEAADTFAWIIDYSTNKMVWSSNAHRVITCELADISDDPQKCFFFAASDDRSRILNEFEAAKSSATLEHNLEFAGLGKSGEEIFWKLAAKLSRDEFGFLVRAFAITKNVTQQKFEDTQRKLMAERFAIAEQSADAMIYDWDLVSKEMWRSPGLTRLLGWTLADIEPTIEGWIALRHPDDQERLQSVPYESYLNSKDEYELEYRMRHREGIYIWVLDSGRAFRNAEGDIIRFAGSTKNISDRRRAESYNARLDSVTLATHDALFDISLNGTISTWNPAAQRLFGYSTDEIVGANVSVLASEAQKQEQNSMISRVMMGETVEPYEAQRMRKDGSNVDISVALAPVKARNGEVVSISVAIRDISDRKEWLRRQMFMTRELAHRNKNSFAVLQGILRSTLRETTIPRDFAAAFSGRLHSLAAAQDVLTANDWKGADLGDLIKLQIGAYISEEDARVDYSGPKVNLPPDYASPLGLIINELTTNSIRFGALSADTGHIEIGWTLEFASGLGKQLTLRWVELGGPKISSDIIPGFGLTIIQKSFGDAKVTHKFEEKGLICTVQLVLTNE